MWWLLAVLGIWFMKIAASSIHSRALWHWMAIPLLAEERKQYVLSSTAMGNTVIDATQPSTATRKQNRLARSSPTIVLIGFLALVSLTDWSQWALLAIAAFYFSVRTMPSTWIIRRKDAPDTTPLPSKKHQYSITFLAYTLRLLIIFAALLGLAFAARTFRPPHSVLSVFLAVACVSVIYLSHAPSAALMQVLFSRYSEEGASFARAADENSVLYLRSFQDDKRKIATSFLGGPAGGLFKTRINFEQLISIIPEQQGKQFIAIGRPNERYKPLGAARTYYPDDQWQDAVNVMAHRTNMIILMAGATAGLDWEVQHLREWNLLSKALIILPPLDDPEEAYLQYANMYHLLAPQMQPHPRDDWAYGFVTALVGDGERVIEVAVPGYDDTAYAATLFYFALIQNGTIRKPGVPLSTDAEPDELITQKEKAAIGRILGFLELAYNDDPAAMWRQLKKEAQKASKRSISAIFWSCALSVAVNNELGVDIILKTATSLAKVTEKYFRGVTIFGAGEFHSEPLYVLAMKHQALSTEKGNVPHFLKLLNEWYFAAVERRQWDSAGEAAQAGIAHSVDTEEARQWNERGLVAYREVSNVLAASKLRLSFARKILELGSPEEARQALDEALPLLVSVGDEEGAQQVQDLLARIGSKSHGADTTTLVPKASKPQFPAVEPTEASLVPSTACGAIPRDPAELGARWRFLPFEKICTWNVLEADFSRHIVLRSDISPSTFREESLPEGIEIKVRRWYELAERFGPLELPLLGRAISLIDPERYPHIRMNFELDRVVTLIDRGDLEKAKKILESFPKIDPEVRFSDSTSNPWTGVELSDSRLDLMEKILRWENVKFAASVSIAEQRLELAQQYGTTANVQDRMLHLGYAYRMHGEPAKAVDVYAQVEELGTGMRKLWLEWCQAGIDLRDEEMVKEKAELACLLLSDAQPDSSDIIGLQADVLWIMGHHDEARAKWQDALTRFSGNDENNSRVLRWRLDSTRNVRLS